jgi:hypothetical protein
MVAGPQPRPPLSTAVGEGDRAVAANIEEGVQLAVAPAHNQHVLPGQLDCLEVARRGERVGAADTAPHLAEQALLLAGVNLGIVKVPAG